MTPPVSVLFTYLYVFDLIRVSYFVRLESQGPMPVATLSKVWVYGRLLAGIADSNLSRAMDACFL
jgi:hypothetical protein